MCGSVRQSKRTAMLFAVCLLVGCGATNTIPSLSYVQTHRALYDARKPYMQGLAATTQPSDAAALRDNLTAEDRLIKSAEAAVAPK